MVDFQSKILYYVYINNQIEEFIVNKSDVRNIINETVDKFSKYLGIPQVSTYGDAIDLEIKNMGTCGGKAIFNGIGKTKIVINSQILDNYTDTDIIDTVVHEVGHVISVLVYGWDNGKGHGKKWKSLMTGIGANYERCHTLNLKPKRKVKQFLYKCGCRDHTITSIKHNRYLKGTKYECNFCKTEINFVKAL